MVYPLLYNGPVYYYARLVKEKRVVVEQYDNYTKQTYRNRCRIVGPNSVLTLSIPVKRRRGVKNHFRDIRIDYDKPWNKIHWKSLVAAYASSPFYEFMADDLAPFYEKRFEFLVDLNRKMMESTFRIMGMDAGITLTASFEEITGDTDPRQMIHPKIKISGSDPDFEPVPYHQVFSDKHGFQPNLSILDLLFNMGPDSLTVLKKSFRT